MHIDNLSYDIIEALTPPKDFTKIIHDRNYIKKKEGEDGLRFIYNNVPFDNYEENKIKEFMDKIKNKNIIIPNYIKKEKILNILYTAKFNLKKAIENLKEIINFNNDIENFLIKDEYINIYNLGILYTLGIDKKFRPIIYMDCRKLYYHKANIELITKANISYMNMVRKYSFRKYHIENWVLIIDLDFLGLMDFPVNAFKKIILDSALFFAGCLHKTYLLNPSGFFSIGWNIVQKLINRDISEKFSVLKNTQFSELLKDIDKEMLLESYGGDLKNLNNYWPIKYLDKTNCKYINTVKEDIRIDKNIIYNDYENNSKYENIAENVL